MTRFFKLGKNSTLFVDPISKKKILSSDKKVEFSDAERRTDYFKNALVNKHIVRVHDDEESDENNDVKKEVEDEDLKTLEEFSKLKVADKKEYIQKQFPDEDSDEIEEMKDAELKEKYAELIEDEEEEEE